MIIPVWNGSDTIGQCLEFLFRSSYRNFEAILVDDGSTDATRDVVAHFPCHQVHGIANAGPAAARNYGARRSSGDILFFLDADILVRPDSLARVVSIFDRQAGIDALFGSFGKE